MAGDANKDSKVDFGEFAARALEEGGAAADFPPQRVSRVVAAFDSDDDGGLSLVEFASMAAEFRTFNASVIFSQLVRLGERGSDYVATIWFGAVDKNSDGAVTEEEANLGGGYLARADADGDGRVNKTEHLAFWRGLKNDTEGGAEFVTPMRRVARRESPPTRAVVEEKCALKAKRHVHREALKITTIETGVSALDGKTLEAASARFGRVKSAF